MDENNYFHTLPFIVKIIYLITNKTKQLFHNSGFKKGTRSPRGDRRIANQTFYMIKPYLVEVYVFYRGYVKESMSLFNMRLSRVKYMQLIEYL